MPPGPTASNADCTSAACHCCSNNRPPSRRGQPRRGCCCWAAARATGHSTEASDATSGGILCSVAYCSFSSCPTGMCRSQPPAAQAAVCPTPGDCCPAAAPCSRVGSLPSSCEVLEPGRHDGKGVWVAVCTTLPSTCGHPLTCVQQLVTAVVLLRQKLHHQHSVVPLGACLRMAS